MSGYHWTTEEIDYIVKRTTVDGRTLQQCVDELNAIHPERNRTYDGIVAALRSRGIKVSLLRAEYFHNQTEADGGLKPPTNNIVTDGHGVAKAPSEDEMRKQLSGLGYKVVKLTEDKSDLQYKFDTNLLFNGSKMTFAVISCTQIGSRYQQMTHLRSFYQYIQERGIKIVLHCGDMVDGVNVYSGHEYELFLHGEDAQSSYCIEHYPEMKDGGKTLVIAGNHDYSFMKEAGCDILKRISEARPDIEYIGAYGAYPVMPMLKVYMQHGGGGGAYARSYKMQKYIEQMAPESKPDLYFLGHYHSTCGLFEYRNVTAFMLGCFQSQTPHERRHGLYPELGGMIVEVTVNSKTRKYTLADFKFEFIPFYIPIENDY
jgi:predicted phosphodiesterase